MPDLNYLWIDIECPHCDFLTHVQLIDVKTERTLFCPNCKSTIKLVDNNASSHQVINTINEAFSDLEKILDNFGK